MSATVTSIAPALRDSTLLEIGRLRGRAEAEFNLSEDLRSQAAKLLEQADRHYGRHVLATTKADDISLRLKRSAS